MGISRSTAISILLYSSQRRGFPKGSIWRVLPTCGRSPGLFAIAYQSEWSTTYDEWWIGVRLLAGFVSARAKTSSQFDSSSLCSSFSLSDYRLNKFPIPLLSLNAGRPSSNDQAQANGAATCSSRMNREDRRDGLSGVGKPIRFIESPAQFSPRLSLGRSPPKLTPVKGRGFRTFVCVEVGWRLSVLLLIDWFRGLSTDTPLLASPVSAFVTRQSSSSRKLPSSRNR